MKQLFLIKMMFAMCNNQKIKNNLNWVEKKIELDKIISLYKNKNKYDCLVPFSGGRIAPTLFFML